MSQHGPMMGNAPLIDELGLTDYLLERWSIGGTPRTSSLASRS
jgi:hypothetical protein